MSEDGIFQRCQDEFPGADQGVLVQCVSNLLEQSADLRSADLKSFLYVMAGAMIFFMQAGFAMLCAGAVRLKNVQNTMLKNLLDACGAAVAFYLIGYAFAFGGQNDRTDTTFIGTTSFVNIDDPAFWFFQYAFSATSVTIVAGTLAERCQMAAYLCYSVVLAGFIYPVVAHSVWRYVQSIMVAYDILA
jgi:ammonium transporter, Amt family